MTFKEMLKKMEEKGFTFVEKKQLGSLYKKATGEDLFADAKEKKEDKSDDDFDSQFNEIFGKQKEEKKKEEKKESFDFSKGITPEALTELVKKLVNESIPKTDPKIEELRSKIPQSNLEVFNKLADKYKADELEAMVSDLGLDEPSNLGYNSALVQKRIKDKADKLADSKMAKNLGLTSKDFEYADDDGMDTFGQIFSAAIQESKSGGGGAIASNVHSKLKELFKEDSDE